MNAIIPLDSALCARLILTFAHFLWQGAALGFSAAATPGSLQTLLISETLLGGFKRGARITLEHRGQQPLGGLFPALWYHIDYETFDRPPPAEALRFHAQWRQEQPTVAVGPQPNVQLHDAVNLDGAFYCSQAVAPAMKAARYGRIVNMSSVVGISGNAGQTNYSASKAGVIGFSKSVAKELAKRNITCNVVAPGFVTTDMTDVLPDKVKETVKPLIPAQKFGEPADIAAAARFVSYQQQE